MSETTAEGLKPASNPKPAQSRKEWLIENVKSLGFALLIVLMIRSSVVEAFKIPSGSMIPTLFIGDHIFVNKFAYGFKIPFVDFFSGNPFYVVKRDPPARGDIIVFKYPRDESLYYIKRVIGVPGDTIEVRDKQLYVNNKPVARDTITGPAAEKVLTPLESPEYKPERFGVFMEHLNNVDHLILQDKDDYMAVNQVPITVPPESLFVMGDNRDRSNDSRFWGFVPYKNVKGKAMVIWLSLWFNFSDGQKSFHPERIGTILH
jgi:signal peptidase I